MTSLAVVLKELALEDVTGACLPPCGVFSTQGEVTGTSVCLGDNGPP